jgi:Flp pilus assembly protein TadD
VMQALKRPALAVWVFRRNAERYPESANVWDSLGDGLLAVGDSAGAKSQFAKAVDIATRTGHPVLAESRSKLESLLHPAQAGKAKP